MRILSLFIFLLAPLFAAPETFYVTQGGAGTGTGLSLVNAFSAAQYNTDTNWTSPTKIAGKISPGDTVILNGTITTALDIPDNGSGAPGNILTILFATGAKLSAPTWAGGFAMRVNSTNFYPKPYVTIDGGTNGIIEATDNGSAALGYTYHNSFGGVVGLNASFFTVKNLTIRNLYIRQQDNTETIDGGLGVGNYGSAYTYTDFTVTNCTIDNCYIGIDSDYGPGATTSNLTFTNNTITHVNWGIHSGERGTPPMVITGVTISGNVIDHFERWDVGPTLGGSYHHNGVFIVTQNGGVGTFLNASVFNNTIGPNLGRDCTACVYLNGGGMSGPILIYNNVFKGSAKNGLVTYGNATNSVMRILNNAFIGDGGGNAIQGGGGPGASSTNAGTDIRNNIFISSCVFIQFGNNQTFTINNNLLFGGGAGGVEYVYDPTGASGSLTKDFAQWQALGFDANGFNGVNPLLNGSYALTVGSPAIGVGQTLSSYFTTDKDGLTRSVPWDLGAFKYGGAAPVVTPSRLVAPGSRQLLISF